MSSPRPSSDRSDAPIGASFFQGGDACGERLALLSARERAVVDLAAEGRTDEQIAQLLGLSLSTVNSYWVRVRGKLGSLGRAEIIAGLIRHQANLRHAALLEENHRLFLEVQVLSDEVEGLRAALAGQDREGWRGMALVHSPEATLVTAPPADVVFANRQARRLFGAGANELEGRAMRELSTAATPESSREPCGDLFAEGGPEEETVGLEEPYYALRRDGTNFRAVVHARRFSSSSGPFAVVTIREYLGDLEGIVRSLRRPLALR